MNIISVDLVQFLLNLGSFSENKKNVRDYYTMFGAELIGTGLLLYLGCMGCVPEVDNPSAVHHMSSFSFGLVILLIIQVSNQYDIIFLSHCRENINTDTTELN